MSNSDLTSPHRRDAIAAGAHKDDANKIRFGLVPPEALERVAAVMTAGAKGRAAFGWRELPNAEARYRDALRRHENKSAKGEARDAQSGESHWAHIAANALICLDLEQRREAAEKAAAEAVRKAACANLRVRPLPFTFFGEREVEHLDGHEVRVPETESLAHHNYWRKKFGFGCEAHADTVEHLDGHEVRVPEYPRRPRYSLNQIEHATRAAHRALMALVGGTVDYADPLSKLAALVAWALTDAGLKDVSIETPTRCGVDSHTHEKVITLGGFRFGVLRYYACSGHADLTFYAEEFLRGAS